QSLPWDRDFQLHSGAFSPRPVHSLKPIPGTSLLVTSGPPDATLQLWQLAPQGSADLIRAVGTIAAADGTGQAWARICTSASRGAQVLHGTRLSCVQLTEVESSKVLYRAGCASCALLSALTFLDPCSLLLCGTEGQLCLADVRQPPCPLRPLALPW
ncbi:WDR73 protein, partial [Tricholaema leucomelas]|nr:WDR73 protein [Tricholaema leucomelas]